MFYNFRIMTTEVKVLLRYGKMGKDGTKKMGKDMGKDGKRWAKI